MNNFSWLGSWEESLNYLGRGQAIAAFYVPLYVLRVLDTELGNRAVGTYGAIVSPRSGHVFLLHDQRDVVLHVTPTGVIEYAIPDAAR